MSVYYWFSFIWIYFLITESSRSSWCKNWARSSGVVPSIPCSWRYWIPLFGFLLNLFMAQKTQTEFKYGSLKKTKQKKGQELQGQACERTGRCLAQWFLSAVWAPQTALGCQCLTSGCCSCRFQTRPWSPASWCSHSGWWFLEPWCQCSPVLMVSPGLKGYNVQ